MLDTDTLLMKRSLELAYRGAGLVSPNPMVGAVLVNNGRVVGEGYHRYDLLKHAESYAIEAAGKLARGATLYCNLEPCCHYGRTPPCTDALIKAGIARASIAVKDPDPRVNGRGILQLREAGIDVEVGLLENRAERLNESYFKFIISGMPFLHGIIEYANEPAATSLDWQPSSELLGSISKYDAVVIGSRPQLNKLIVDAALHRQRHRPLVIAADKSDPCVSQVPQKWRDGKVSVVPVEIQLEGDPPGNVVRLEEGMIHPPPRSQFTPLLSTLSRMGVTSVLSLPGLLDSSDAANFREFDKVTLAVPSPGREQPLAAQWNLGDIEFDLEEVCVEKAGDFTEVTGYPSLREVA